MKRKPLNESGNLSKARLPSEGELVIVVTRDFRVHGYLDASLIWRFAKEGGPIEGVVGWDPIDGFQHDT